MVLAAVTQDALRDPRFPYVTAFLDSRSYFPVQSLATELGVSIFLHPMSAARKKLVQVVRNGEFASKWIVTRPSKNEKIDLTGSEYGPIPLVFPNPTTNVQI